MLATNLDRQVDELLDALEHRDEQRFHVALPAIAQTIVQAPPGEVQEALARLANVGDVPDPDDPAQIEATLDRFVGGAPEHGLTERDASMLVQAWFCGEAWVQPVLYLAQRKDVRGILPDRSRLTAATEAVRERSDAAHWLHGLLLVLDDEPLIVLHRATGRGFRLTISGVGDNFQLHTLLAAALIGEESAGKLAGQRRGDRRGLRRRGPDPFRWHRGCFNLTVSRRLAVVCGFYRTCVIDAILIHSPADYVRRPTVPPESPTLGLSHLQFEAMITTARTSATSARNTATGCCGWSAKERRSSWFHCRQRSAVPSTGPSAIAPRGRSCAIRSAVGWTGTRPPVG